MEPIRIQKYLADMGVCSRRQAENLIQAGKVKLNGETIVEMGVKIDPDTDKVTVYGKEINNKPSDLVYIALNKPMGYISSVTDNQGKSIVNLLSKANYEGNISPDWRIPRVFPVGRLDKDSEGLVLLTNDGELTNIITHPRYEHEKEYIATIRPLFELSDKAKMESTMIVDGEKMSGLKIKKIVNNKTQSIVTITLTEGKNRQIRRMFGALNYTVDHLARVRINKLQLKNLPSGRWTLVKREDII